MRSLDPAIQRIWMIKRGLATLLFVAGTFFYELIRLFAGWDAWFPFGVLTGAVLFLGGLWSLLWPRLMYRHWHFELQPEELFLERGVLNRVRTVVPLRRIQHLDVSQDLLEREYGLGKLIVHTAGARSSDVVLPGLAIDEAERLRDEVRRYILEREDALS